MRQNLNTLEEAEYFGNGVWQTGGQTLLERMAAAPMLINKFYKMFFPSLLNTFSLISC